VTSPAESPRTGPIGLAILDAAVAEDGTKVEVGGTVATVAVLSILDPEKTKPRA
jgi:glycine cleavage system aminomethyltransferase T